MRNGNIPIIVSNTVCDTFPHKFCFTVIPHTGFEITDGYKTVLFYCVCWNNRIFHIAYCSILLKLWCTIRVIDGWLGIRVSRKINPLNFVVMWISMSPGFPMIGIMPFYFRTTIRTNFCLEYFSISHGSCIDTAWFTKIALIFRFIGTWSPLATVSAATTLANPIRFHYIIILMDCTTDFIAIQIFFRLDFARSSYIARNCGRSPHKQCCRPFPGMECCSR